VRASTLLPPSRRGEALDRQKLPLETRTTFSATVASGRGRPQEAPAGSTGSRQHRAALLCGKAADRTGSSPAPAGKKGCRGVSGRGGRAQCTWGPGAQECKGVCLFDCVCVHKALVSVCVCVPVCASVCVCVFACNCLSVARHCHLTSLSGPYLPQGQVRTGCRGTARSGRLQALRQGQVPTCRRSGCSVRSSRAAMAGQVRCPLSGANLRPRVTRTCLRVAFGSRKLLLP